MYRVALTGGIGSGKSIVANLFAKYQVPIIDTDLIAHELTAANGSAIVAIKENFGAEFINAKGSMDRVKMRNLIFSQPQDKKKLEKILHPLIYAQVQTRLQQLSDKTSYVLIVIPLLLESWNTKKWHTIIDRVLVVDCLPDLQKIRVMQRNQLSLEQVEKIMAAQVTRFARLAVADDVIDNNDELKNLLQKVKVLHQQYVALGLRNLII